ncbi:lysophospholipase [Streptomyces sp. RB6PN25]|uniref:Lysophospholipase n=1 Tax=Streptomyces humicola TaxID=2953240 RepID=A0ABT1PTA8_9ACTN|nr:alpha/beta fold hydrolase [Streptomyces humicola]MCQ4080914.1 lysophospholipase [Streptomyces humicola]
MSDETIRPFLRPRPRATASLLAGVLGLPVAPLAAWQLVHALFHPPLPERRHTAARFGLYPEDLRIPLPGAGELSAWLCRGDPRRVVVLGHGLGRDKTSVLPHARFLHRAGFTVLLFDFRNHGDSFRDRGLTGYYLRFVDDVVQVIRHVRRLPEYAGCQLVLYGFSLATFAMLRAMFLPELAVDAAVFDGGPSPDPSLIPGRLLRAGVLSLPRGVRRPPARDAVEAALAFFTRMTLGGHRPWPPPPERGGAGGTPMLFVTGAEDRIIHPEETRRVAAHYPTARTLTVPRADHLQTLALDRETYTRTVLDFLHHSLHTLEGAPR